MWDWQMNVYLVQHWICKCLCEMANERIFGTAFHVGTCTSSLDTWSETKQSNEYIWETLNPPYLTSKCDLDLLSYYTDLQSNHFNKILIYGFRCCSQYIHKLTINHCTGSEQILKMQCRFFYPIWTNLFNKVV